MDPCYLDNSATTRPFAEVIAVIADAMAHGWHNPSAAYAPAVAVEDAVEGARASILKAAGGRGRLVFTSGGTEADNLAVLGAAPARRSRLIFSATEHPAVQATFMELKACGHDVVVLPVDREGAVCADAVADAVDDTTALVSVMHVNNETGVVQDIAALAAAARGRNPVALFHSDGVQAFLRVPSDPVRWGIGMYALSAHKVHGPKGVGALVMADGVKLKPQAFGGGQEGNLRSGTLNVPGILGFAKAVEIYSQGLDDRRAGLMRMKLALAGALLAVDGAEVNGPAPEKGAPHILNVSFDGVRGEVLLRALSERNVYVSTGAACGSRQRKPSAALKAMGLPDRRIDGAVRLSLSVMNTMRDVERAAEEIAAQVKRLRMFTRR